MATLCSKCKKRPAVVFIQRMDSTGGNVQNEGFCLLCAKDLGIKPVTDMIDKLGIDEDQLEEIADGMSGMMSGDMFGLMTGGDEDADEIEDDEDDGEEGRAARKSRSPTFRRRN